MRYTHLIFDLDGTLVDSLPGIEASARDAAARHFPERILPSMRQVIGPPIQMMFARLWPDLLGEQLAALVARFREHYDAVGCLASPAYPAVHATLARLSAAGITMFVLTNKPERPARAILKQNAIAEYFSRLVSPDSAAVPFGAKSEGAQVLQRDFQLDPRSTLLVGDGVDDLEAARACGFDFAIAGYGYGNAVRACANHGVPVLKTFSEIATLVL